jgi:hypothetical protein
LARLMAEMRLRACAVVGPAVTTAPSFMERRPQQPRLRGSKPRRAIDVLKATVWKAKVI